MKEGPAGEAMGRRQEEEKWGKDRRRGARWRGERRGQAGGELKAKTK